MESTSDTITSSADVSAPIEPDASASTPDIIDAAPEAVAPVSAPEPVAQQITAESLAQANAQYLQPILQQFAPKPAEQPHPWANPKSYWGSLPEDRLHETFHERQEAFARHVAQAEVKQALESQRQEFQRILQGQAAYFQAQFARDPNFVRYEKDFNQLVNQGVPPAYARELAELRSGGKAPAASGPRAMPAVPRSATSPATRSTPPAQPKHKSIPLGDEGAEQREVRFMARAKAAGFSWGVND